MAECSRTRFDHRLGGDDGEILDEVPYGDKEHISLRRYRSILTEGK